MTTGNNGPIFVGGVGRSGTTLMRLMLDSHSRICCGPELKVLPGIASMYRAFVGPWREQVMNEYCNSSSDLQGSFRTFIEGLVDNFRRASGKPRWADKSPENVGCMVTLGEIFPEARFIHMLRDGRDVACSLVTMNWIDHATGRKVDYVETMTAAARHWRETVLFGREQAEDPSLTGRVLEVCYEELVTETAATMRQVLAFLGVEWEDAESRIIRRTAGMRHGCQIRAWTMSWRQWTNAAWAGGNTT